MKTTMTSDRRRAGAAERPATGSAAVSEGPANNATADEVIIRYRSRVWTPTLRSGSRWRVLSWRAAAGGFRMVSLENIKTGKRIAVCEQILRASFSAKRVMAAIFAPAMERRAA